jgi:glycosyltransferase involved in cell wall biosynthesis
MLVENYPVQFLPRVSIITPSLNQAQYLEQCILSVLEQDYPNIEYIIMDGGSTDGSVDIIRKYSDRLAYWVSQPDNGQSAAINTGLCHSTGEIWGWMNADDAYMPDAIGKIVNWLQTHPKTDIVYGDCVWVDEHGDKKDYFHSGDSQLETSLLNGFNIPSGSTFLRRSVYENLGGLDENLHNALDTEYWMRATLNFQFEYIPVALSLYRVYPLAKTWNTEQSERRAREAITITERFWQRADLPIHIKTLRPRSLALTYLFAAELAFQANKRDVCIRYIQKSLSFGRYVIRPRLARLLWQLWLGKK